MVGCHRDQYQYPYCLAKDLYLKDTCWYKLITNLKLVNRQTKPGMQSQTKLVGANLHVLHSVSVYKYLEAISVPQYWERKAGIGRQPENNNCYAKALYV